MSVEEEASGSEEAKKEANMESYEYEYSSIDEMEQEGASGSDCSDESSESSITNVEDKEDEDEDALL